jgi:hypothetical protein
MRGRSGANLAYAIFWSAACGTTPSASASPLNWSMREPASSSGPSITIASLTGIFAVQDEVTQKIIDTLIAHISRSEIERARTKPPETFSAYDYWLRGNAIMKRWEGDATGEQLLEARTLFQRAMDADPAYVPPLCGLARTYAAAWIEPWSA